ncbi:hypothetical protein BDQ12DRAFT_642291 [Crucibulum laeve]|uniref:Microbial-type PARG catalytic domain-containing protein n=1 Tax=Crucibulum laeve TaxID=68775 RepID=A0A5C3MI45_9AGAR|nr:hypothetical protein BDQ12DRAFT_642291 [Crucibulum laeve]
MMPRLDFKGIAATTVQKLDEGSYEVDEVSYDLKVNIEYMKEHTIHYASESELSAWSSNAHEPHLDNSTTEISALEISVLEGARALAATLASVPETSRTRIGVLNFASAKKPGGGFLTGAQAQEESIARSSTLYPSLTTNTAQQFYKSHKANPNGGYYSHAMIYSPKVLFIRNDKGDWQEPLEVDILTSPAVNAGLVRRNVRDSGKSDQNESGIEATMKERMGRLLYLFKKQGVRNLVLGSFGTGVFRNKVELVVNIWKELLVGEEARFKDSFDRIVFAVLGTATFRIFDEVFNNKSSG